MARELVPPTAGSSTFFQQNSKRAEYGEQLIDKLGKTLAAKHGEGYSARNLRDMRRFFEAFQIRQAVPAKSVDSQIPQPMAVESPPDIRQAAPAKSSATANCSARPSESSGTQILPPAEAESEDRIIIDFTQHHRLGWTHYRILLGVEAGLKRGFYFEQAAQQRWATRELQRQIDRALFERVALSRDTKALVRLEKHRGPVETVCYDDAFKEVKAPKKS